MRKLQLKLKWRGDIFALPSLIGVSIFYFFPFLRSLFYTFTQGVAEPHFVGGDNFRALLADPLFLRAADNTLRFLLLGVPLLLGVSLLLSVVAVKRPFRWQRWCLLLPMIVPASSMALGWRSIWGAGGVIGQLLGRPETDFLAGKLAFPLLLALYLLKNIGFLTVIFTGAIRSLPLEYREIFILESNSERCYIRTVLLPLIFPAVLSAALLAGMDYFLLFRDIYALYGSAPPKQLYMLQHFMNSNFYRLNYQQLSAAAFLTAALLSLLIAVLLQRRNYVG